MYVIVLIVIFNYSKEETKRSKETLMIYKQVKNTKLFKNSIPKCLYLGTNLRSSNTDKFLFRCKRDVKHVKIISNTLQKTRVIHMFGEKHTLRLFLFYVKAQLIYLSFF